MLAGWRVVRFTYDQVADEPAVVAATLRGLLAREVGKSARPAAMTARRRRSAMVGLREMP